MNLPRLRSLLRASALALSVISYALVGGCSDSNGNGLPPLASAARSQLDLDIAFLAALHNMDGDPVEGETFPQPGDALVDLGMRLFFSKSLGADRDSACVTCHHPLLGGGDDLTLSIGVGATDPNRLGPSRVHDAGSHGFDGGPTVPRNAPTTFNIGLWRKVLFHDGRVENLVTPTGPTSNQIRTPDVAFGTADPNGGGRLTIAQARFPVTSPEEMKGHTSGAFNNQGIRDFLAQRLGGYGPGAGAIANTAYWLNLFRTAFNNPTGTAPELVTYQNIAIALAAYQRSQVLVDAPWFRYLRGDTTAISDSAKRGAQLFLTPQDSGGKGCATCHTGDFFTDEGFFNTAIPQLGRGKGNGTSGREDFGRARETNTLADRYKFRTPTLLNVSQTGPWGHSGAYTTLRNMVAHYRTPLTAAASYDNTQLTQPGVQNLGTVAADTQGAVDRLRADRAAGLPVLADTPMTDAEITDIVEFLKTLTDPCTESSSCMQKWIPDPVTGADPNGDQLNATFAP